MSFADGKGAHTGVYEISLNFTVPQTYNKFRETAFWVCFNVLFKFIIIQVI